MEDGDLTEEDEDAESEYAPQRGVTTPTTSSNIRPQSNPRTPPANSNALAPIRVVHSTNPLTPTGGRHSAADTSVHDDLEIFDNKEVRTKAKTHISAI